MAVTFGTVSSNGFLNATVTLQDNISTVELAEMSAPPKTIREILQKNKRNRGELRWL